MAKLTKTQKRKIKLIAIYYADASAELEANGMTPKYDRFMWVYVRNCDQLGLDVASFERDAADRYWARTTVAA